MRRRLTAYILFIFSAALLAASCAGRPALRTAEPGREREIVSACTAPFLTGKRRLVHSIQATMPGGGKTTLIGVTLLDPATRRIEAALMTIEGLVLFEGTREGALTVRRAIPPFDVPSFAQGLMDDIALIFFHPEGTLADAGTAPDGSLMCRYTVDKGTVYLMRRKDNTWKEFLYSADSKPQRIVDIGQLTAEGIPARVILKAKGMAGYALEMDLIEMTP